MKIKFLFWCFACLLVISLLAMSCSSAPSTTAKPAPATTVQPASSTIAKPAQVTKLKFSIHFPPASGQGVFFQKFCEEINKRTNGQVEITYFPGGTLFDEKAAVDNVKSGIADISFASLSNYPGRFPVSEVITSVNGYPSAYVSAHVTHDFYNKIKPKEWNEHKVLLGAGFSPMMIVSTKPINTLKDYAGSKSRVKGWQAQQAKLLGASTVDIPAGDMYDALQKGVIDNTVIAIEAEKSWRLAEICKYYLNTWQIFTPPSYYLFMNLDSWNKLPDNIKQIFDQVCAEYVELCAVMCNSIDVEGAEFAKQANVKSIDLSPEESAKWKALVEPLVDKYVQPMVAKGYSESEVRGWISFINERIDYWLKQQAQKGIKSPMGPPEIKG